MNKVKNILRDTVRENQLKMQQGFCDDGFTNRGAGRLGGVFGFGEIIVFALDEAVLALDLGTFNNILPV